MPKHAADEVFEFSVATAPATASHRRLALAVVIGLLIAYAIVFPYRNIPLPRIDSFIPTVFGIIFVTDLITAALLFAQFAATGSRPLLMLASGFLFSALLVGGYALTFPGAFAPANPLGAGPQSSTWLYLLWRIGFAASLAIYAAQRSGRQETAAASSPRPAIAWSVALVTVLACALIFVATAGHALLPSLMTDGRQLPVARYATGAVLVINVLALFLLLRTREKTILDVWLIVAAVSWLAEGLLVTFFFQERFSLSFYALRVAGLPVSKVVLIVLLWETIRLYTSLTISHRELQRERASRLTNAATIMGAIVHDIRQPLAAINLLAYAGQRLFLRTPPDVRSGEKLFGEIKDAAARANGVFENFLRMIRGTERDLQPVDVNALTLEAIGLLQKNLDDHQVTTVTKLAPDLPVVQAHAGQIREVLLNLIQNAIDAVATTSGSRVITITTSHRGAAVAISLQDTGPGIAPEYVASIFDPFVTHKEKGTGLGLAICKMIVDQHGGILTATSGRDGGARFEIVLPTKPAAPANPPELETLS